jgi:hypothetical protein
MIGKKISAGTEITKDQATLDTISFVVGNISQGCSSGGAHPLVQSLP